jgi:hypothetical protein
MFNSVLSAKVGAPHFSCCIGVLSLEVVATPRPLRRETGHGVNIYTGESVFSHAVCGHASQYNGELHKPKSITRNGDVTLTSEKLC